MSKELLVDWLHRKELSQTDKLLILLGTFDQPAPLKEIIARAEDAGFKRTKWSNPSASLRRATGSAINTSGCWEITKLGLEKLTSWGVELQSKGFLEVATDLRAYLSRAPDNDVKDFVTEAVYCFEHRLNRSSVVMSWLAAVFVLQKWVFCYHIADFNKELKRVGIKPLRIKTMEDFDLLKESDFLDRISAISLIGKTRKAALKRCLDFRNNCGHPNALKVSDRAVAAHLEVLIENVFLDDDISNFQQQSSSQLSISPAT